MNIGRPNWLPRGKESLIPYLERDIQRARKRPSPNRYMRQTIEGSLHYWCRWGSGTGPTKSKSEVLLGCTKRQMEEHLESFGVQYRDTLNYELDHIRPCSSFNLLEIDQIFVCYNWRNYRPLETTQNQRKSDKWTPEDEADWEFLMRIMGFDGDLFLQHSRASLTK